MCINPAVLANGQSVACHKCWQCVRRKIDDWTGRCIAESQTSVATHSVTLTYGRDDVYGAVDHVRAAVLTYSDVQRYFRAFRDFRSEKVSKGFSLRYFVVGEYGSMKGRAHWHAILFWGGPLWPYRPLNRNIDCPMWPHGHSHWQNATPEAVRYVTKYIAKEVESEERQYHKGLSRMPPLGDKYFRQLAQQYVEQRLAPQDLFYDFDESRDRNGKKIQYMMQGKTRENFLNYFTTAWSDKWGDHAPTSELVELHEDRMVERGSPSEARRTIEAEKVGLMRLKDTVPVIPFTGIVKKPKRDDLRSWMDPSRLQFFETLHCWAYVFEGGQRPWFWARDANGVWSWRGKIGSVGQPQLAPRTAYGAHRA